jgi:hypothetical protein
VRVPILQDSCHPDTQKLSKTSFAIYRHQAKIFIVSFDGPIEMVNERSLICQRVTVPGDY